MLINGLGNCIYPLLTIILKDHMGLSGKAIGVILMFVTLIIGGIMIGSSMLLDRFGCVKMIKCYFVLGIVSFFCCTFTKGVPFLALLFIGAASFQVTLPAFNTLIVGFTKPKERKNAFVLMYLANNIGYSIASFLSGMLYHVSFVALFLIDALTALLSVIFFTKFIKEKNKYEEESKEEESKETHQDSVFSMLKKYGLVLVGIIVMFIFQIGYVQWGFLLPIQLMDIFAKDGVKMYGILGAINGICVITCSSFLSNVLKKKSTVDYLICGGVLYALSFILFANSGIFAGFICGMIILTVGEIFISTNFQVFVAENVEKAHRARMNSISSAITGSGLAIGSAITGALEAFTYKTRWIGLAGLTVLACLLLWGNVRRKKIE